jgi:hypothetical protein
MLATHTPRIIVMGNHNLLLEQVMGHRIKDSLDSAGYTPLRSIGDTWIYVYSAKQ